MKKIIATIAIASMLFVGNAFADNTANSDSAASAFGGGASAVQGQGQDQFQQNQLGINDVGNIKDSFNSEGFRGFGIPGDVQYGPVLNYFGKPLPSEGFQPVEQLIMYSCWFTEGSLESLLKGVEKARAEFKVANTTVADAAPAVEDGTTKWIKIVISRDKYEGANVDFKGYITTRSDSRNTTMTEVMAKAALAAMQNGCNVIHFTAQGAVRDVMSSGWGIGFNTTQAQISDGQRFSNVTSGGTGYSSAKAGTRDLPWLQGFGLIDRDLVYPALAVAPVVTPADAEPTTTVVGDDGTVQSIVGGATE